MLQELFIKNFAIIDDLAISFSDGLTILSGETGAGKSVIINAVNLLLGARASAELVRTGAEAAELEAAFRIPDGSPAAQILDEQGYDASEGLIVRRIISAGDRHRIYINGRMAPMKLLGAVTEHLASISGQHAHQTLLREERHLDILDQFGGLAALRETVRRRFHDMTPVLRELKSLKARKDVQADQIDLLRFQKSEIEKAGLTPGEEEALEQERTILKNGEALFKAVQESVEAVYDAPDAVVARLAEIGKSLETACAVDPKLSPHLKTLTDAAYQLEDAALEMRSYLDNLGLDEQGLEAVESRLDVIRKLKRKYGGSVESALAHLEKVGTELDQVENLSSVIAETEARLAGLHDNLAEAARHLSGKRAQTAQKLAEKVEQELAALEMPHTRFEISLEPTPAPESLSPYLTDQGNQIAETGLDRARFMIAPNPGEAPKALANIASGGELSRVVLALKAILAETESVATIVFDEVDAGIGGKVAEVVGRKLAALAQHHQVICITHLPQIAKFGDRHFRISKQVADNKTRTVIEPLGKDDRVTELARMLGGATITRATLEHAGEMLENAG